MKHIARKYKFNPNWLMALMNSETGGTFDPAQKNLAGSGATGLIQFMPTTATSLGTSTSSLARMNNIQQLQYVDKYIGYTLNYLDVSRIRDYDDLYLLIFYPRAVGKPDSWAFPGSIYNQNAGIDMNNDGIITVRDFKKWIRKEIPEWAIPQFVGRYTYQQMLIVGVVVLVIIVAVILWVRK